MADSVGDTLPPDYTDPTVDGSTIGAPFWARWTMPVHVPTDAEIAEQMDLRRGNYVDNRMFVAPVSFEAQTTMAAVG